MFFRFVIFNEDGDRAALYAITPEGALVPTALGEYLLFFYGFKESSPKTQWKLTGQMLLHLPLQTHL
jgi:hypothetical protein